MTASLREKKKETMARRICREAMLLFRRSGFRGTTMDEIARASDVSRATVFNYFSSKRAILLRWLTDALDSYRLYFDEEVLERGMADGGVDSLIRKVSDDLERDKPFYREVLWEVMNDRVATSPGGWWTGFVGSVQRGMREWFAHFSAKYSGSGWSQGDNAAEMLSGTFAVTVLNWLSSDADYPLFERLKMNLDIVWRGLAVEEKKA